MNELVWGVVCTLYGFILLSALLYFDVHGAWYYVAGATQAYLQAYGWRFISG